MKFQHKGVDLRISKKAVLSLVIASLSGVPAQAAQAVSGVPPVGEYWATQGGVNLGLVRAREGIPEHYLILATDEKASFKGVQWGCYGTEIPGASSNFDGLANTNAMAEAGSQLAKDIRALRVGGFDDWFLPARTDARLAFVNGEGFFEKEWHWTSTQSSALSAWNQNFDGGGQLSYGKKYEGRARVVRRAFSHSIIQ